jgi:UDP-N-acetylmuramate--alanine ligase
MDINRIERIFFLGIGGIGMSAMARYFHERGVQVSGYDKTPSPITQGLAEEGIRIGFGDDFRLVPQNTQLCIYTPAIPADLSLIRHIREAGIPLVKRAEILGMMSAHMPCVAVAGTHGKTSICHMLAHILKTAGVPSLALLGGISANYNTNYLGDQDPRWLIAEADEFDRSFLHLRPELAVITSMDADHLDIYGSKENLVESFSSFAGNITEGGTLLVKEGLVREGLDSKQTLQEKTSREIHALDYGIGRTADYQAENIRIWDGRYVADFAGLLRMDEAVIGTPGRHNVENALAAAALAQKIGVDEHMIRKGLASCKGVKRRFEILHQSSQSVYIDDYAHHPSELTACIQTARELFPGKNITGVFQPHLFSRTRDLASAFAQSLSLLDDIILLDIYPAREEPLPGVTAHTILDQIPSVRKKLTGREKLLEELEKDNSGVLITMGAGDIDRLAIPIKEMLIRREQKK